MDIELTLDCNDLDRQTSFWQAALECDAHPTVPGRYVSLMPRDPRVPALTLQLVPETKAGKNRLHLDLLVDDLDGTVAHLRSLGATELAPRREEFGARWYVLADPEGNEFCVAEAPQP
ncbi:MAG TPA: VOC family protein [Actinomycetes bacterium]